MARKAALNDLDWFDIKRYAPMRTAKFAHWANEITSRLILWRILHKDMPVDSKRTLFDTSFQSTISNIGSYEILDFPEHVFEKILFEPADEQLDDIDRIGSRIGATESDPNELCLKLDLRVPSDILLKRFKAQIAKAREERATEMFEPVTEKMLEKWHREFVLPLADIRLFCLRSGLELPSRSVVAKKLESLYLPTNNLPSSTNRTTEDNLRKTWERNVADVINEDTLRAIYLQIYLESSLSAVGEHPYS